MEQIYKNIFKNEIFLPNTPLKILNCYIILSEGEALVIDTGFNAPECETVFMDGLRELSVDIKNVTLFITHLHSDHCGLAGLLHGKVKKIYMGAVDAALEAKMLKDTRWLEHNNTIFDLTKYGGTPLDHTGYRYRNKEMFDHIPVYDGDVISMGAFDLKAIHTPGHTPGHICLYNADNKIMFTGDHILGKITPNISFWGVEFGDILGKYFESLRKIQNYDVELPLAAHRAMTKTMHERVEELLKHHAVRLAEVENILASGKEQTVTEVASQMTWDIRAENWQEFPMSQKIFASHEAMTHLTHLVATGKAEVHTDSTGKLIFGS